MGKIKFKISPFQKFTLVLIVFFGLLYVTSTYIYIRDDKRAQVLQIAKSIEASLPKDVFLNFDTFQTENTKQYYEELTRNLNAIARINKNSGVVYIYIQREGKLYVVADSESDNVLNSALSGQENVESDQAYFLPFKNGEALVTKPVHDRWGTWISVLVPIKDEKTGNIFAVFGMDFDARSWQNSLIFEVFESAVLMVLLLLVLYFLFKLKHRNNQLKDDIGKLRRAEEVLREREEKYRYLFSHNPQPMWIYDLESLRFLEVNIAAITNYGYSRDEFLAMTLKDIRPAEDISALMKDIELTRKSYNPAGEWRHVKKNGEIIFVEIASHSLTYEGKNARHVLVKDITDRLKTQSEIHFQNIVLNSQLESSVEGILILNEEGKIIACNQRFVQMWGIPADLIGQEGDEALLNYTSEKVDDPSTYLLQVQYLNSHRQVTSREEILLKDGDVFDRYSAPMVGSDGQYYGRVWYFNDITDRINAEKQLKLLGKAIDQSPVSVVITDVNGIIEYVNQKFTDLTGYTQDETRGRNSSMLQSGQQSKEFYRNLWETIISGNDWVGQFHSRKKTGELYWESAVISPIVNNHGVITNFVGVKEDITDKKKAFEDLITAKERTEASELKLMTINKELKEKNTFIQTILDNLPIGLSLNNINDGKFSYMNKKFENLYGWSSAELTTVDSFFELVYPDAAYRMKIKERVLNDINSGNPENMHWEKIHVTHKDGSTRIINAVNIPLIDQNTMVSTVLDFTKLYKTQKKLIKAKEKAEESDRLKSSFLANMSHEIRTPMNGILGFASLLREPLLSGEEQQEYISIIEKSGVRMLSIINDIVSLSKVEAGQMEVTLSNTNLNDQIDYIYKFFKPEAEQKGIVLVVKKSLSENEAVIRTDSEKVYAVLINLVKNALKFTTKGAILFGYIKKDQFIEFFVKDTGLGIRDEQKSFIFERFRQGNESYNRNYEGAGLGLSISKAYVEMLGGSIWVESEEGKGSEFHFTLPYVGVSLTPSLHENQDANLTGINKIKALKILIVEDDKTTALLLSTIVKKFAKEILKGGTGVEGLELCRKNPDIDLILMDIKMPVMDGYEATRQIRLFNKEVIIIAQSAFALSGDAAKAIAAGCNEYMAKPFGLDQFTELLVKYFKKQTG